jgi:hypothetical protein
MFLILFENSKKMIAAYHLNERIVPINESICYFLVLWMGPKSQYLGPIRYFLAHDPP